MRELKNHNKFAGFAKKMSGHEKSVHEKYVKSPEVHHNVRQRIKRSIKRTKTNKN